MIQEWAATIHFCYCRKRVVVGWCGIIIGEDCSMVIHSLHITIFIYMHTNK
jgi:hypothetical protein